MNKTKTATTRTYKYTNDIIEDHGDWLLVDISTPKFPEATMAVDTDVFEAHEGGRIYATISGRSRYIYARYKRGAKLYLLHRDVINITEGMVADHINHGSMLFIDNRLSNIRTATSQENGRNISRRVNNSSGITGVCWRKDRDKWHSFINISRKKIHLGYFDNIEIAIGVRQQAEREYFGEFAFKGEVK